MTPEQIDRVFGRGRMKVVTGAHVEVFREAAAQGERRRYTKRFLTTEEGDYAQWTEREWRILARLIGHRSRCVPDVVQYDRDTRGTKLVQTYDAGATVDQWATILPVERDGRMYAHVFEDCAHWWALAHHCLVALDAIHAVGVVHLDVKGDNICIPVGPANFDVGAPVQRLYPVLRELTLIDFAFSLVSGESLATPLPIGWQQDYDYQSPRLLRALEAGRAGDLEPTWKLDWRCDMYSIAAMLKRYLPGEYRLYQPVLAGGWTHEQYDAAKSLILRLREIHDLDLPARRPHSELIARSGARLGEIALARSLERGWTLARAAQSAAVPALPLTPVTRLAPPLRLVVPPRDDFIDANGLADFTSDDDASRRPAQPRSKAGIGAAAAGIAAIGIAPFLADSGVWSSDVLRRVLDAGRAVSIAMSDVLRSNQGRGGSGESQAEGARGEPAANLPADADAQSDADAGSRTGTRSLADASSNPGPPTDVEDRSMQSRVPASSASKETDSVAASRADGAPTLESPAAGGTAAATPPPPQVARGRASPMPRTGAQRSGSRSPYASRATGTRSTSSAPRAARTRVANRAQRIAPAIRRASGREAVPVRSVTAGAQHIPAAQPSSRTAFVPRAAVPTTAGAVASTPAPAGVPIPAPAAAPTPTPTVASATAPAVLPSTAAVIAPATAAVVQPATTAVVAPATAAVVAPITAGSVASTASPVGVAIAKLPHHTTPANPSGRVVVIPPASQADTQPPAAPRPSPAPSGLSVEAPVDTRRPTPVAPNRDATGPGRVPVIELSRPLGAPPTMVARPPEPHVQSRPGPPREQAVTAAGGLTSLAAASPPPVSAAIPGPPATRAATEMPRVRPAPADIRGDEVHLARARRALAELVPWSAANLRARIARVLWMASRAHHPEQEHSVADAAASVGHANDVALAIGGVEPGDARRLHEQARLAYRSRDIPDALELALKAFGANPGDPEIAGHLAFLHLKVVPERAEISLPLALYAIGLRSVHQRTGWAEDWTTLAIASALTGRPIDARDALYVAVALARNVDRLCREAVGALARHGERLREPVEALLYRMQMQGRSGTAPFCAWPPVRITRYP